MERRGRDFRYEVKIMSVREFLFTCKSENALVAEDRKHNRMKTVKI